MKGELTLSDILYILKRRWFIILGSAILGLVVAFLISNYFITPKYTSSTELYVYGRSLENGNNTTGGNDNLNELNYSQKLVSTYIVVLQNRDTLEKVAEKLDNKVSAGQLKAYLSMGAVNQTEVLRVSAVTEDPQLSADICNAMGAVAPDVLMDIVKAGSVSVIGKARVSSTPTSPNIQRNSLLGMLIGIILSAGVLLLLFLLDNTVKGEEDLRLHIEVPVLGEVPRLTEIPAERGSGHAQRA